jgi:hypothetical protein
MFRQLNTGGNSASCPMDLVPIAFTETTGNTKSMTQRIGRVFFIGFPYSIDNIFPL